MSRVDEQASSFKRYVSTANAVSVKFSGPGEKCVLREQGQAEEVCDGFESSRVSYFGDAVAFEGGFLSNRVRGGLGCDTARCDAITGCRKQEPEELRTRKSSRWPDRRAVNLSAAQLPTGPVVASQ